MRVDKFELADRGKAASVHFTFSFFVVSIFLFVAFKLWYWPPIYHATGFFSLVWLIVLVDLCAGPLATFVVWKKGKKGLLMDMVVIGLVQFVFLGYGLYSVAASRPVFYVFVVDDFEMVNAASVIWPDDSIDYQLSTFSSPKFVGASFSKDPDVREQQRNAEIFDGISLARKMEAYEPIEGRAIDLVERAKPLHLLNRYNSEKEVESVIKQWPHAFGYLPLKAPAKDLLVLIDHDGRVLGIANLEPW